MADDAEAHEMAGSELSSAAVQVFVFQAGAWVARQSHRPYGTDAGGARKIPHGEIAGLFTYAVPPDLMASLAPGQLVQVQFGAQIVTGLIWDLSPPPALPLKTTLRPLYALLDPLPVLDAQRRSLALWLAEAYVCSLADAVRLMLPGLTGAPRIDLVPTGAALPDAVATDPEARALLGLVRHAGGAEEAMVRGALGKKRAGQVITALEAQGALARDLHRPNPRLAMSEPWLRLIAAPEALAAWRAAQVQALLPVSPAPSIPSPSAEVQPPATQASGMATIMHMATEKGGGRRGKTTLHRGKGALLQALATAGPAGGPPTQAGGTLSAREAARRRGAIALVDLLATTPDEPRSRRETLRLTRATPAALDLAIAAGLVLAEEPPLGFPVGTAPTVPHKLAAARHDLNPAQATALARIVAAVDAATELALLGEAADADLRRAARPILLHGVTGSGKTEVYLQAMEAAIARGRQGIVLVPEIALTPQAVGRFASRFPGRVALLHSALRPAERAREWGRIRSGSVDVVIGSRSAIFAPLPDLGLIILDEEHEASFKQDEHPPTYHAREVALALAALVGAAVVLGSATPSVETTYRALSDEFDLVMLPERVSTASTKPPPVAIVDLRAELREGHVSILSRPLLHALHQTMARREQAVLYLNRRGSASCVLCRDCGFVVRCGRCDVPLTHHQGQEALLCHYCGWSEPPPVVCLKCGGAGIRYFGVGTEKVEATVRELFPQARVLRWDNDTVRAHTDHARFAEALADRQADILVGTQMIAKGLDVPGVTLVGIIAADIALYLPDYRATERAFQLLTQVAGRAGRGDRPGQVILQTFSPDHFCIEAASRHDYEAFYSMEIAARTGYGYPPFRRFVKLTYTHQDRHACQAEALSLGDHLARLIADMGLPDTDLVGPAPAFMERLRGHYRWQIILRGPDPRAVIAALTPEELGSHWAIDIDPLSSL